MGNLQKLFLGFQILVIALASQSAQAYVGGRLGSPSDFPSSVRLTLFYPSNAMGSCSGVKIQKNIYLTAAHCVIQKPADKIEVVQQLFLSTKTFLTSESQDLYRPLIIRRIFMSENYVNVGINIKSSADPLLPNILDLALIEVEDGLSDIPVASLSEKTLKRGDNIVVGGYGKTTIEELLVNEEPFATHKTHLRWDDRTVAWLKPRMFSLVAKASFLKLSPFEKLNSEDKKLFNEMKNARINRGDSGGAAWMKNSDGKPYVVGINALLRGKNFKDLFRGGDRVEHIVRVDKGSEGYDWVQNVLKLIHASDSLMMYPLRSANAL